MKMIHCAAQNLDSNMTTILSRECFLFFLLTHREKHSIVVDAGE